MRCFNASPPSPLPLPLADNAIDVALLDSRARPNINSMLRIGALLNASTATVRFHAILAASDLQHRLPGFLVHPLRLSPEAQCLHAGLSKRAGGNGPSFLLKPLLPWILPTSLRRIILLDSDVVPLRDIRHLHAEFSRFCGRLIGLVREQSLLYQRALHLSRAYNGGVQLLDLDAMRRSRLYAHGLERAAHAEDTSHRQGWQKAGFLGDQTLYSFLAADTPGKIVHDLPCEWNRQLGSDFSQSNRHADTPDLTLSPDAPRFGFTNGHVHSCPRRCGLLHANYPSLKCIARWMHANPSCGTRERRPMHNTLLRLVI